MIENMIVKVDILYFSIEFRIMNIKKEKKNSLFLDETFMQTTRMNIDIDRKKLL